VKREQESKNGKKQGREKVRQRKSRTKKARPGKAGELFNF
jgi:hypothetical protein